ncbi:MAG: sulfotransferase [Myxococcota bacterium]
MEAADPSFEPEAVLDEARTRTGLDEFGDDAFMEPMRRLLIALEREARLNEIGRITQFERIVGLLVNRLRTEDHIRRYPEIVDEVIDRPFSIVGLGRTGTTMLHRTIASDPRMYSLAWYESRNPAPFPGGEGLATDPRIADAEAEVQMMLEASPDLIAAHPMDAHAPDEEIMLLEHAFISGNPEAFCNVPEFARWLEDHDARPGYVYLKRLLQFLQWQKKRHGSVAERWVLKSPHHIGFLDVFFDVFPDARVILTHRDPVQTIPSFMSLIHAIRVLGSDEVDLFEIGRQWGGRLQRMMDRCIAFHRQHPERFFDIHYEPLIADPMAKTRDIYRFIGAEWTADAEAKMRQWAVENAREKRPVHRYTLEKFGFTEAGLRADFANYGRFVDELLEK